LSPFFVFFCHVLFSDIHRVKLLKKDKGGSPEAMTKLPQMAKQLEVSLYRNARSFEAYMDMNTLKQRLQQIAVEVSRKARSQSQGGGGGGASSENGRDYSNNDSQRQSQSIGGRRPEPPPGPPGPGGGGPNGPISPFGGGGGGGGPPVGGGRQMVDMSEINPMATSGRSTGSVGAVYGGGGGGMPMPPDNRNNSVGAAGGMPNRNDPEWKIRIRHKQQRLLLLHHSAKCMAEEGRCQVTPHCADMKRLWRHMEGCKDNNCRISHCFSSRAILSHYRKCKDPACPACGPVRETVRKSRGSSSASASQGASSSSRIPGSSSTGPMMNAMRGMAPGPAPPQQQQRGMMSPSHANDPMGDSSRNSYAGAQSVNSYSLSGSSRSNMPPPSSSVNGPGNPGMQFSSNSYSSHNRPIGNNPQGPGGGPGVSVQPVYGSDRQQAAPKPPAPRMQQQPPSRPSMPPQPPPAAAAQLSASRPSGGGGGGSGRNDSEWQKIRHKQQRLLLLRHASRCQHEAGKCPVTPHCASMKKLWEHIAHCKNQQCTVQHCLSSRYVLSHYRRCKDARCPACGPVRETIRKSHEREKSRTAPDGGGLGGDGGLSSFDGMNRAESFNQPGGPPLSPPTEPERKRPKMDHMSSAPTYPDSSMNRSSMATITSSAPPPLLTQEIEAAPLAPVEPSQSQPQVKSGEPGPPSSPTLAAAPESAPVSELPVGPASALSDSIKEAKDTKVLDDCSLLESFTVQQLQTHLKSLERKTQLPPAKLKAKCVEVLKGLQTHQHGWVFNCPVDPVELGLPDYFQIIKKPMDLGTIQRKLESGTFHAIEDFAADVYLTFDNAMTYNEDGSVVYDMAKELKVKFEGDMKKLMKTLDDEDQERRQNERACMLCGCEKLLFEPPVYFCNGMNCQSQRIRRNSHFYIGGNNQYFWCSSCYNELDDKIPIELVDMTIKKADLKKKKNDEVHEESWVQCDTCEKWVHQICGLFNTRQNKEHHSEYCCPKCLLDKRQAAIIQPTPPKPPCAVDLPRTALSEWLENSITKKIARRKRELAVEKAANEVCNFFRLCGCYFFFISHQLT
jgi:Bromodomain/TAZ zinc finger